MLQQIIMWIVHTCVFVPIIKAHIERSNRKKNPDTPPTQWHTRAIFLRYLYKLPRLISNIFMALCIRRIFTCLTFRIVMDYISCCIYLRYFFFRAYSHLLWWKIHGKMSRKSNNYRNSVPRWFPLFLSFPPALSPSHLFTRSIPRPFNFHISRWIDFYVCTSIAFGLLVFAFNFKCAHKWFAYDVQRGNKIYSFVVGFVFTQFWSLAQTNFRFTSFSVLYWLRLLLVFCHTFWTYVDPIQIVCHWSVFSVWHLFALRLLWQTKNSCTTATLSRWYPHKLFSSLCRFTMIT